MPSVSSFRRPPGGRCAVLLSGLLAACSSGANDVAGQWNDSIRRYNLVPIYPMQEDVQIGDVFIYAPPVERGDATPATWLNRIGGPDRRKLADALRQAYCERLRITPALTTEISDPPAQPAMPPPPDAGKAAPAPGMPAAAASRSAKLVAAKPKPAQRMAATPRLGSTPISVDPAADPRCLPSTADMPDDSYSFDIAASNAKADLRLHAVELPRIKLATVTSTTAAGGGTLQGITLGGGIGGGKTTSIDIGLTGVEEIHLPVAAQYDFYLKNRSEFLQNTFPPWAFLDYVGQKRPDLLPLLCYPTNNAQRLDDSRLTLFVANEVVYAHNIIYTFGDAGSFAAQLSAHLASPGGAPGAGAGGGGGNGLPPPPLPDPKAPAASDAATAAAQLATMQAQINALAANQTAPGGTLQFGVSQSGNLSMNQAFAQPRAFGIGNLIEFTPSELLRSYRSAGDQGAYDLRAASVFQPEFTRLCGMVAPPKDASSLYAYVLGNQPQGQRRSLSYQNPVSAYDIGAATIRRFRPSEGLP